MIAAIEDRRSIRSYQSTPVSVQTIEQIIQAGRLAPSSKNRQPWKFIVTMGEAKEKALEAMEQGLKREKSRPFLPISAPHLGGAEYTLKVMRQAPVVLFVLNPLGLAMERALDVEERIAEICNQQSMGACLENMSLAATEMGLGCLWIGDIFFAYQELNTYLDTQGKLVAAMALGYANESPQARPRKSLESLIEWRIDF